MGCEYSNSRIDLNKEQYLNHETISTKAKDIKILTNSNNNIINDNIIDNNLKKNIYQDSNYLI